MERIMDKEKSYQMQVTYLNIDKVLFALFLVVNCFVCNNTCCAQTTIESYPKDFCLNKLSDLVKDKPFKEELGKYPFIAEAYFGLYASKKKHAITYIKASFLVMYM